MTDQVQKYANITAAGTFSLVAPNAGQTSEGVLHCITIQKATAQTITVYDGDAATGTVIATFPVSAAAGSYFYDIAVTKGLTVVTAASFAGDVTVCYQPGLA
jgi:hypothetical protein